MDITMTIFLDILPLGFCIANIGTMDMDVPFRPKALD
jgi:hypothetical protein